jgi:hypothetical protein
MGGFLLVLGESEVVVFAPEGCRFLDGAEKSVAPIQARRMTGSVPQTKPSEKG